MTKPIDEVLQKTARLLNRPEASWVDDKQVRQELRWPVERAAEVRDLMAELIDEGDLRGRRNRGDNQLLDVDVSGVTRQGQQRLAEATRHWWLRVWLAGVRPAARAVGGIVALVIAGVLVAVLSGYAPRFWGLLPK